MKVELQGEGTYTYGCDKPDCYHCYMMGLKPIAKKVKKKLPIKVDQRVNNSEYHRQYRRLISQKLKEISVY